MNWLQFFKNAGIPDAAAQQYYQSFVKNRIQQSDLADLDKDTLSQLGVKAIGDQLAILRSIKKGGSMATTTLANKSARVKIEAPDSSSSFVNSVDTSMASFHRKGRPPPDSQEIYHVKMPQGTTPRTRQILRKATVLKSEGILRGTTGVRQGGRPVSPIDKTSVAAQKTRERGPAVRVIHQHLTGRPRATYATNSLTVSAPNRQQRNRITFGDERESRSIRTFVNNPIGKVVNSSRIMKRIERPGSARTTVHNRMSYADDRNGRVQYIEEEYDDEGEEVIYEDDDTGDYMEDDDGYEVEYVEQQPRKKNIFSRMTM